MKRLKRGMALLTVCLVLFVQTVPASAELTSVKAKAAVLVEAQTGETLFEMNAHARLAAGSVTKLMSILLFMEALEAGQYALTDTVTVSEFAKSMGGSEIWLEVGEQMSVDDLLKAVCIQSANDATVALAEFTAGTEEEFLSRMNQRAEALGMTDTCYCNTTGFDEEGQYTSAADIALVARELMKHPTVFQYSTVWMDELRGGKTMLTNTNKLLKTYNGITGLKTGTTDDAGYCFCGTAEREGVQLISVVLGCASSEERFASSKALLDYGFAGWTVMMPEIGAVEIPTVKVLGGLSESVAGIVNKEVLPELLPKGEPGELTCALQMAEDVAAPVEKNQRIGTVSVCRAGKVLREYPVLAAESVEKITVSAALRILFRLFLRIS